MRRTQTSEGDADTAVSFMQGMVRAISFYWRLCTIKKNLPFYPFSNSFVCEQIQSICFSVYFSSQFVNGGFSVYFSSQFVNGGNTAATNLATDLFAASSC